MTWLIDNDETRIQRILRDVNRLNIRKERSFLGSANNSNIRTGISSGSGAATNPYPLWMPVRDLGTISSPLDIVLDRVDGHVAKLTAAGDITFAFSNPPPNLKSMSFYLDVTVDGTGGYTFTLPSIVIPAGVVIDNTANARTVLRIFTDDNGATFIAENITTSATRSPLTTKGDIFGFSTGNARIPVGTNGQVLVADSAEELGVKWAAVGGGGEFVGPWTQNHDAGGFSLTNTGDILPTGVKTVGDATNFYNQMHSQYFITQASSDRVLNRYGLANNSGEIYINYTNTNDEAGFAIYEQGVRQFRFSNPVPNTMELLIGRDPHVMGETYSIVLGEDSTSRGVISHKHGANNDLIINRDGGGTTQGVQIRAGDLTVQRWFTNRTVLSRPLDAAGNDLQNVVNIHSNGEDGINILTNGTEDDININAAGATSDITLVATGIMEFVTGAGTGMNFLVDGANRFLIQNSSVSPLVNLNMNENSITGLDEIVFRSGRQHEISAQSNSLQLKSESTSNDVEIWNGTGADNETLNVGSNTSIFQSKGNGSIHTLLVRSSAINTTGTPAIGNFGMDAQDSLGNFGAYAGITVWSQIPTSTGREGRMRLVVANEDNNDNTSVESLTGVGMEIRSAGGSLQLGFYGKDPVSRPIVTGSKDGNDALENLLTQLVSLGLITDDTT